MGRWGGGESWGKRAPACYKVLQAPSGTCTASDYPGFAEELSNLWTSGDRAVDQARCSAP